MATIIRPGKMVDVETLRDLWESDLARAGWDGRDADEWDQVPIPIIRSAPETTWIWSDLHLGDPSVISVFGRPFIEVGAMNAFLLGEWRDRVQAGHTIICLGDVLHEDVWRNESLMNHPPGTYVQVHAATADDSGEVPGWDTWKTIRRANPLIDFNKHLKPKLEDERRKARRDEDARRRFQTYRLNVPQRPARSVLLTVDQ